MNIYIENNMKTENVFVSATILFAIFETSTANKPTLMWKSFFLVIHEDIRELVVLSAL